MNEEDKIIFPEFKYVQSFDVNSIATKTRFDLYKNEAGQYITVNNDIECFHKSVMFYRDYEHLTSVFKEEFTELEMLYWK